MPHARIEAHIRDSIKEASVERVYADTRNRIQSDTYYAARVSTSSAVSEITYNALTDPVFAACVDAVVLARERLSYARRRCNL